MFCPKRFTHFCALSILALGLLAFRCEATSYYVSPAGSDSGDGSQSSPFASIAKASSVMVAGDDCWIATGTYRETILPAVDDVSYRALEGHQVVVSGFEEVEGWSLHSGSIYVADISSQLGDENQVFVGDKMMQLARWPNKTNDDLFDLEMVKSTSGTTTWVRHPDIPDQDWANGGSILYLGKSRWTSWRVALTGSAAGKVDFAEISDSWDFAGSHSPAGGGEFYLMNTLAALDSVGEWYIDRNTNRLYLWSPGGGDPSFENVQVRQRTILADLSGRAGVTVRGIEFFGGGIDLQNAQDCVVRNCRVLYGNHTIATGSAAVIPQASIALDNNSVANTVYKNEVLWGAGSGVVVKGLENMVDNNIIGNFDYLGCYASPVEMRGSNYITRNEIFNAGRDCVRGGGNGSDLGYNNIHHANLINDDCGGVYMCCGDYTGTRIHHNWIHDIESRNNNFNSYKATGVYLDNSTIGVTVDHNVFWNLEWSCIQINWQGENLELHNNTLWSNAAPNSASMKRWVNGYEFVNVNLSNTLANESEFHANSSEHNCVLDLNATPFEDFANQNFVPKAGTCAVDGGVVVPGITDTFEGGAPDIGAYERGGYVWTPGPDWKQSDTPFVDRGLNMGYAFDASQGSADIALSDLTVGRGHQLLGSVDLLEWEVVDAFLAPEDGQFDFVDLETGDHRFFRAAEKIKIPQAVSLVSATLQKDKLSVKLRFSGEVEDPSADVEALTILANGGALGIQSLARDTEDLTEVLVTLSASAPEGQALRLSYTPSITSLLGVVVPVVDDFLVDTSISDLNLVAGKNGDAEFGNTSGWQLESANLDSKVSVVEDPVHSGQYAIQAIYDSAAGTGLVNLRNTGGTFTVVGGATYDIGMWHYGKDLDGIDQYTTELSIYNANTGEVELDKRSWQLSDPNQWNQTTARVTFGASEGGTYVLGFRIYSGHYTLIVDDASVVRVE